VSVPPPFPRKLLPWYVKYWWPVCERMKHFGLFLWNAPWQDGFVTGRCLICRRRAMRFPLVNR
jgi:hypothetical protein